MIISPISPIASRCVNGIWWCVDARFGPGRSHGCYRGCRVQERGQTDRCGCRQRRRLALGSVQLAHARTHGGEGTEDGARAGERLRVPTHITPRTLCAPPGRQPRVPLSLPPLCIHFCSGITGVSAVIKYEDMDVVPDQIIAFQESMRQATELRTTVHAYASAAGGARALNPHTDPY